MTNQIWTSTIEPYLFKIIDSRLKLSEEEDSLMQFLIHKHEFNEPFLSDELNDLKAICNKYSIT